VCLGESAFAARSIRQTVAIKETFPFRPLLPSFSDTPAPRERILSGCTKKLR